MKVLYIAHEFPLPSNHGGKVDIFQRLKAFRELDVEVFLITWYGVEINETLQSKDLNEINQYVSNVRIFEIRHDFYSLLKRIFLFGKWPSSTAARFFNDLELKNLISEINLFNPDFTFLDGIYGLQLALECKQKLNIQFYTRTHNIEHKYLLKQARNAGFSRKKFALFFATFGLEKYERFVLKKSKLFFDISLNDLDYWSNEGYLNGRWLPPILDKVNTSKGGDIYTYDIAFIGNLYNPNNVDGVIWFISEVLPLIRKKYTNKIKVLIMGSNPLPKLVKLISQNNDIEIMANVENPDAYLQNSKVLINPIRFGSGVTIKTIDMIFLNNAVVSCSQGIMGLPQEIRDIFSIADTKEEFADAVIKYLYGKTLSDTKLLKRVEFRKLFSKESVKKALSEIQKSLNE